MSNRSTDPLVGAVLDDRYQIVRRIARGGMATVFEAIDVRLERTVAVKVMRAGLDRERDVAERFDAEARAAALLSNDPHIVAVFDQGNHDGRPYIVMEYVRGLTLRQIVTLEAPLPPKRALQLIEPVVAALSHAHAAGLIHCDVKPENVLVSEHGQVKLTDFGLAQLARTAAAPGEYVIGTVSYIAPELVSRGLPSPRSDVYSVGIMLYELLTGEKPHRGENQTAIAQAHVSRDVPAPSAAPRVTASIPESVDLLVTSCTARTPRLRPRDAGVLLAELRTAQKAVAKRPTPKPGPQTPAAGEQTPERPLVAAVQRHDTSGSIEVPGSHSFGPPSPPATGAGRPGPARQPNGDGPDLPISPYSPPRRPSRRTSWARTPIHRRRRLLVAAVSLILVVGLTAGGWAATVGRLPTTPALAGLALADARTSVTEAGLTVQFISEYSDSVPAGVVIRTDPASGARLKQGSIVLAYLSQGTRISTVPALQGVTRDEALRLLAEAGLTAGAFTERYDKAPAGTVISQSAPAGSPLRHDATVDVELSLGLERIALADWTGRPTADARAELTAAGFKVKVVSENSPTIAKDAVISQTPAPGDATKGDTITLVSSRGPVMVAVPNVRRMAPAAAQAKLEKAGFTVIVAPAATPTDRDVALSTLPASGTKAAQGSQVTLQLGS